MAYEKLTFDLFKDRLAGGHYDAPGGARKAVGKSDWPNKQKDEGRALIDAHFEGATAKPKAAKPAVKAAPVKERAKPGPKPGSKKPGPKPAVHRAAAPTVTQTVSDIDPRLLELSVTERVTDIVTKIMDMRTRMSQVYGSEQDPEEVKAALRVYGQAISAAESILGPQTPAGPNGSVHVVDENEDEVWDKVQRAAG